MKKPLKFRNQRIEINGIIYDSRKEARRHQELLWLEKAGRISNIRQQVRYVLAPSCHLWNEPKAKPPLRYYADFVYEENGQEIIEDVKSPATRKEPLFRAKLHLMKTQLNKDVRLV